MKYLFGYKNVFLPTFKIFFCYPFDLIKIYLHSNNLNNIILFLLQLNHFAYSLLEQRAKKLVCLFFIRVMFLLY